MFEGKGLQIIRDVVILFFIVSFSLTIFSELWIPLFFYIFFILPIVLVIVIAFHFVKENFFKNKEFIKIHKFKNLFLVGIGISLIFLGIYSLYLHTIDYLFLEYHMQTKYFTFGIMFLFIGVGVLILGLRCGMILGIMLFVFSYVILSVFSSEERRRFPIGIGDIILLSVIGLYLIGLGVFFEYLRRKGIKYKQPTEKLDYGYGFVKDIYPMKIPPIQPSIEEQKFETKKKTLKELLFDKNILTYSVLPRLLELAFLGYFIKEYPHEKGLVWLVFPFILLSESIIIMREEINKNEELKKYNIILLSSLLIFSFLIFATILPLYKNVSQIYCLFFPFFHIFSFPIPFISFHLVLKNYSENRFSSLLIPLIKIVLLGATIVLYLNLLFAFLPFYFYFFLLYLHLLFCVFNFFWT